MLKTFSSFLPARQMYMKQKIFVLLFYQALLNYKKWSCHLTLLKSL